MGTHQEGSPGRFLQRNRTLTKNLRMSDAGGTGGRSRREGKGGDGRRGGGGRRWASEAVADGVMASVQGNAAAAAAKIAATATAGCREPRVIVNSKTKVRL